MDIRIEKGTVKGKIQAPPSKSYAHRMLICAALASGNSIIHGISGSEDMLATIDCICALGRNCVKAGSDVTLSGSSAGSSETAPVFKCRESGSTLRFFIPIAMALTEGGTFCGSRRLIERGITVYEEAFENSKVSISTEPEQISISGRLAPGTYRIRGDVSSQFVSGLLFALPLLEDDSDLYVIPPVESRAYIDLPAV